MIKFMVIPIISALVLISFSGVAYAQTPSVASNNTFNINIQPDPNIYSPITGSLNAANPNSSYLEFNSLAPFFQTLHGEYYGAYLRSSLFQLQPTAQWVKFQTTYSFSNSVVMNGVNDFWVRVPIVPSQYSFMKVAVNSTNYKYTNQFVYTSSLNSATAGGVDHPYNPIISLVNEVWDTYPNITYISEDTPFNITLSNTTNSYMDNTGLYIQFFGVILPNVDYTFTFWGLLNSGQAPEIYITSEDYQTTSNTSATFYTVSQSNTLFSYDYSVMYNQTLPINLAYDFVFLSSTGPDGTGSFTLYHGQEMAINILTPPTGGKYLTFFMPYQSMSSVTWQIIVIAPSGYVWNTTSDELNASNSVPLYSFSRIVSTSNGNIYNYSTALYFSINVSQNGSTFLMFTTPYLLGKAAAQFTDVNSMPIIILIPSSTVNVLTYMYNNDGFPYNGTTFKYEAAPPLMYTGQQSNELSNYAYVLPAPTVYNNRTAFNAAVSVLPEKIRAYDDENQFFNPVPYNMIASVPIFYSSSFTTKLITEVTPGKFSTITNYFWGFTQYFPGNQTTYVSGPSGQYYVVNNTTYQNELIQRALGGLFAFNGTAQPGSTTPPSIATWIKNILSQVTQLVASSIQQGFTALYGFIKLGFNVVVNALTSIGKFLALFEISVYQTIFSLAINALSQMQALMSGLFTMLPILFLLIMLVFISKLFIPDESGG